MCFENNGGCCWIIILLVILFSFLRQCLPVALQQWWLRLWLLIADTLK